MSNEHCQRCGIPLEAGAVGYCYECREDMEKGCEVTNRLRENAERTETFTGFIGE